LIQISHRAENEQSTLYLAESLFIRAFAQNSEADPRALFERCFAAARAFDSHLLGAAKELERREAKTGRYAYPENGADAPAPKKKRKSAT